jgi:hypothetical protein
MRLDTTVLVAGTYLLSSILVGIWQAPAAAQDQRGMADGTEIKAVLELFTSQGCSSCPPADAVLAEMAREPDVIALTLPVDYWDYLGWKDTLAQHAFTLRQRSYANARGDRQVFTPQMVVNGIAACVGTKRREVEKAIREANGDRERLPVPIAVRQENGTITVEVGAGGAGETGGVWLLPVTRAATVAIAKGENRGRSAAYANVVRGTRYLGLWSGRPARFEVPVEVTRTEGSDGFAVLLQTTARGRPGPILGAARSAGL